MERSAKKMAGLDDSLKMYGDYILSALEKKKPTAFWGEQEA